MHTHINHSFYQCTIAKPLQKQMSSNSDDNFSIKLIVHLASGMMPALPLDVFTFKISNTENNFDGRYLSSVRAHINLDGL